MTALLIACCQIFAAYLIFKWVVRQMKQWDLNDQQRRLESEASKAKQLSEAVLKRIDETRTSLTTNRENKELTDLLLLDAMNREARAKASLIAVLQQHGCTQTQIDEVIAKIDNQQHTL